MAATANEARTDDALQYALEREGDIRDAYARGLTREQVARDIGVAPKTLDRMELRLAGVCRPIRRPRAAAAAPDECETDRKSFQRACEEHLADLHRFSRPPLNLLLREAEVPARVGAGV